MRYWRLKDMNCSFVKLSEVVSISRDDTNKVIVIVYQSGKDVSYFYHGMKEAAFFKEYADLYNELEKVGQ